MLAGKRAGKSANCRVCKVGVPQFPVTIPVVPTLKPPELTNPFAASMPVATAAVAFAIDRHAGQLRDADRTPFVRHPIEVGRASCRERV